MISNLKYIIPLSLILVGCATPSKPTIIKTIKFESTPSGGLVEIIDQLDGTYTQSCTTPCALTLDTNRTLKMVTSKAGYLARTNENLFYRDPTLAALSDAINIAMTGKPIPKGGQTTIKIEFLTEEQQRKRDEEKALKQAAKEAERAAEKARFETVMSDDVLEDCETTHSINTGQKTDRDAIPLVRVPPVMPLEANKSGHCIITMNVSPTGIVSDVIANYCTDEIFKAPSIKSVTKWKFNPKIVNSKPVSRCGVETKMTFKMMNAKGELLPE